MSVYYHRGIILVKKVITNRALLGKIVIIARIALVLIYQDLQATESIDGRSMFAYYDMYKLYNQIAGKT